MPFCLALRRGTLTKYYKDTFQRAQRYWGGKEMLWREGLWFPLRKEGPGRAAEPGWGGAALRSLLLPVKQHLASVHFLLQNQNLPNKNHPGNRQELKRREHPEWRGKTRSGAQRRLLCARSFPWLIYLEAVRHSCLSARLSSEALSGTFAVTK